MRAAQRARRSEASFHVPGHKRGAVALESARQVIGDTAFAHDLTELPGLDYLAFPKEVIKKSQKLASTAFQAKQTWFLVNGTTVGIHAAVMASCRPGDCLLLARNCHQSAFAAAVFAGCDTVYVQPECDAQLGIAHGVCPEALQQALEAAVAAGKQVKAVLVVSPTYFGAISDVQGLAQVCHRFDASLIVDEAHGSHLVFDPAFPQSALSCGADCVIQSSHKTLSALTQAAMLHVQGTRMDAARISQALQLLQSSSPSYLLMASLDGARAHAQQQGVWEEPLRAGRAISSALQELPGLEVLSQDHVGIDAVVAVDPLRVTVGTQRLGLTGNDVSQKLEKEFAVVAELATQQVVVFALGIGTKMEHAEQLIAAFKALCRQYEGQPGDSTAKLQQAASCMSRFAPSVIHPQLSLRDAFFASTTRVAAAEAVGRVSAELLCPYPPGVPLAIPGEVLQQDTIQELQQVVASGGTVTGASDASLATHLVIVQ
ncbi:hypothetical protein ABBQ32_012894 [Trebouxia sp. C0010 RCD-2024]